MRSKDTLLLEAAYDEVFERFMPKDRSGKHVSFLVNPSEEHDDGTGDSAQWVDGIIAVDYGNDFDIRRTSNGKKYYAVLQQHVRFK